jgi:hypothetical protein
MERSCRLAEVTTSQTRGGNTRYVARDTDPQEAAWRTAVEAAPWLVGKPGQAVPPDELHEKLKPFEERVAKDIERSGDE